MIVSYVIEAVTLNLEPAHMEPKITYRRTDTFVNIDKLMICYEVIELQLQHNKPLILAFHRVAWEWA